MKIGFLDTWYGILAPEQENMKRYANYLKEHGHSFEFLTPDGYLQRNTKVHANDENFDLILCTDASGEGMEILPDVPTCFVNWCPLFNNFAFQKIRDKYFCFRLNVTVMQNSRI